MSALLPVLERAKLLLRHGTNDSVIGNCSGFDFGLCGCPRPCQTSSRGKGWDDTVITASTMIQANRVQTLGVIVYLAQARHSSYGRDSLQLLRLSVRSLMQNYNFRNRDDMLFLHAGDINMTSQRSILAELGPDVVGRFKQLGPYDFEVPPGLPPRNEWAQARSFSVGYRHMIRLFAIGLWGIVAREGYEYVMRMDEDSFVFDPIQYNVFERMRAEGLDYVYRAAVWDRPWQEANFFKFVKLFLEAHQVRPKWLLEPCRLNISRPGSELGLDRFLYRLCGPLYGIYNNFFASRVAFWLEPQVQAYLAFVAASNTIYTHRWNDILWHSIAIQSFVPRERVRMLRDFTYEHMTFRSHPISKDGNILGLNADPEFLSGKSIRCMQYGGLALGTNPSPKTLARFHEMMHAPVCRDNDRGQRMKRPCVVRTSPIATTTTERHRAPFESLFLGPVQTQSTHCDGEPPKPYYCHSARKAQHSWYGPECECDPMSARTSNFTACFSMLRDEFGRWGKAQAEATNGSWWVDRQPSLGAVAGPRGKKYVVEKRLGH
jgi:hypothetical protein